MSQNQTKVLLQTLKSKLFDINKRNQAINFKAYKTSTVKIIYPLLSDFLKLSSDKRYMFAEVFDRENMNKKHNIEQYYEYTTAQGISIIKQDFYESNELEDVIKTHRIKHKNQLYTNSYTDIQNKALYHLNKRHRLFKDENAINILYVAAGFLNWFEAKDQQTIMKSPLFLIPASIYQKAFDAPYHLELDFNNIELNEALIARMKQDFNLNFMFDIDDEDYFLLYQNYKAYLEKQFHDERWFFDDDIYLGLFSFSKINMVKDLEENIHLIAKHPVIEALITGKDFYDEVKKLSLEEIEKEIYPKNFYQPLDADASQSEAIQLAIKGKSFVLQGPPGTGKSQTITNIISEFIARNKKVLFVAEKKAALDVVYNNLKKIGLEEFALPLHNQAIDKKEIVKQLLSTLDISKKKLPFDEDVLNREYTNYQTLLKNYANLLTEKTGALNKNLFELIGLFKAYELHQDLIFDIPNFLSIDEVKLEHLEAEINSFYATYKYFDFNLNDIVWKGFKHNDLRLDTEESLKKSLTNLKDTIKSLYEFSQIDKNIVKFDSNIQLKQLLVINDFYLHLLEKPNISQTYLDIRNIDDLIKSYEKVDALYQVYKESYLPLEYKFNEKALYLPTSSIKNAILDKSFFTRLFSKKYRRAKQSIKPFIKVIVTELTNADFDNLHVYQQSYQTFSNFYENLEEKIGDEHEFSQTKENLKWYKKFLGFLKNKYLIFDKDALLKVSLNKIKTEHRKYKKIYDAYLKLTEDLQSYFKEKERSFIKMSSTEVLDHINRMQTEFESLQSFVNFNQLLERSKRLGLKDYYETVINKKITNYYPQIFLRRFYLKLIDYIIGSNDTLKSFNSESMHQTLKSYQAYDEQMIHHASFRIRNSLSESIYESKDKLSEQIKILKKEALKSRKLMPVRMLFNQIPKLIQTLKPVLMMSPLSVSSYLKDNLFEFDLVIFDEASQIKPESAIGAIYRAKQVIIVGDREQLPPTSFFENVDDETSFDAFDDFDAFESILDVGHTFLDSLQLKWHYRSKFEQLIKPSNNEIYQNLITFPNSHKPGHREAIEYIYVDGVYHERKNEIEAERVVDLIFEHYKTYLDKRSLGVVTLNEAQQTMIESALHKRRRIDKSIEPYLDPDIFEAFFIKNIETVQGDERDTIIMSVGYGPDKKGKISLNFGPISKAYGYRRLNVATTRAKYNMIVVTSLKSSDIDLSRATSVGASYLKKYLHYAEHKDDTSVFGYDEKPDFLIVDDLKYKLENLGYNVDKYYGVSKFKIDLAVQNPNDPTKHILAIEIDGSTYLQSTLSRDSNRLKQSLLKLRGWNVYRVWAMDWLREPNKELTKIDKLLTKLGG